MNQLFNSNIPLASELRISPRIILVVFLVTGVIVHLIDDLVDDPRLVQFGLLIYGLVALLWVVDDYSSRIGPWLTLFALNGLIAISHFWFNIPDALFLLNLTSIVALVMVGFAAAVIMTLLSTGLLVSLFLYSPAMLPLGELSVLLVIIWATLGVLCLWHRRSRHLAHWAWEQYTDARSLAHSMRDERIEHRQLEADLLISNRELARLTSRLKAMHQLAEEARQTKERFVANVSHELRTPLNMIIGFSDIISRSTAVYGVNLPPALLADIAAIRRNSQHLAKLVDDVLDLSQIELGRMALSKEWTSLEEVVQQATTAVEALYTSKKLYLSLHAPTEIPIVYCDSTRIRQVLINLLSNAGRFTEKGGVQITIRQEGDMAVISVADTGQGIAPDNQKRLFEPFYQVDDSLRRRHDGNGLGLSISKQFVKMHRGKMWVESELGSGTTVHFSLPLQPAPADYSRITPANRYNPNAQFEWRNERSKAPVPTLIPRFVILEEGNTLTRLFARYRDGIEVSSVQTAEAAVEALKCSPAYALIINATSHTTASLLPIDLSSIPYNTPIITCWVADENMAARELGVDRYLVKPVSCELLLSTVASLEGSQAKPVESVLIVDDDREVLQLFARMLASAERPYRILQATNGRRAIDLLRERQPDLMLLDLEMPKMNGFQVLEQKSQDHRICHIPVVVISARDPHGQPIVSHQISIAHHNGLSAANLLTCIQAIGEILSPGMRSAHRVPPEIGTE